MSKTARSDEPVNDPATLLRIAAKASAKPRARKAKALALPPPEPARPMNPILKTLLVGAAGGLVGGLIVRSADRRSDFSLGSTVRAVLAVATAWASWSNRRHGNV